MAYLTRHRRERISVRLDDEILTAVERAGEPVGAMTAPRLVARVDVEHSVDCALDAVRSN